MRNLFLLLRKYNFFLLVLVTEVFCFYLIIQSNNFQRASFVNSANVIAANIQSTVNAVTSYINLKTTNDALAYENAALRSIMPDAFYNDSAKRNIVNDTISKQQYSFITAKVINNSVNRRNNYLTLNRGSNQGVRPEMGVISPYGIVGIVKDVSPHFCSVMSFLHKDSKLSALIKKSGYKGSLVWNDLDDDEHASLRDIAPHVPLAKGDTLVTSSFSAIFPEGIMIGTIEKFSVKPGDNFYAINVKLSTSFSTLSYVYIVDNELKDEQRALEKTQEEK